VIFLWMLGLLTVPIWALPDYSSMLVFFLNKVLFRINMVACRTNQQITTFLHSRCIHAKFWPHA
jgi:hypothetical protein